VLAANEGARKSVALPECSETRRHLWSEEHEEAWQLLSRFYLLGKAVVASKRFEVGRAEYVDSDCSQALLTAKEFDFRSLKAVGKAATEIGAVPYLHLVDFSCESNSTLIQRFDSRFVCELFCLSPSIRFEIGNLQRKPDVIKRK
jgi:hypothetical protein